MVKRRFSRSRIKTNAKLREAPSMSRQFHVCRPGKRFVCLLFVLCLLCSMFTTAYASDSFFISGIVPANNNGVAYVQVTDLEGKINNAVLYVDDVAASAQITNSDSVGTTYWFVIDVSNDPSDAGYNGEAIEAAAKALTTLPASNKDNVRIVWVSSSVEVTSVMSVSQASALISSDVQTRYSQYGGANDKSSSAAKNDASDLSRGISEAVEGALDNVDRFNRIYIVTDGANGSSLTSLASKLGSGSPVTVNAILMTNSYSPSTQAYYTSGHSAIKSFVADTNGLTYTLDMARDVVQNKTPLTEQASIAASLFQEHIENAILIAVPLTAIYNDVNRSSKSDVTISSGSTSDVRTVDLNWSAVPTPTATPTSASEAATEAPTPMPVVTPKPEYKTLTLGDVDLGTDTYISDMQIRLKELGFLSSSYVPGEYDLATARALKDFAEANTLTLGDSNGNTISERELRQLFSSSAQQKVSEPVTTPEFIDLTLGDEDTDGATYIQRMQARLAELGYYTDTYTLGIYDEATANALNAFCKQAGLNTTSNSEVTANILRLLANSNVTPSPAPTHTPVPALMSLSFGHVDTDEYSHVSDMQDRLRALGYLTDATVTYGTYDVATAEALCQFCTDNNTSPVDSGYSAPLNLLRMLMSSDARPRVSLYKDLSLNDVDAEGTDCIIRMQSRLNALGYYDESFTPGVYGQSTANALLLFCQQGGYDVNSVNGNGEKVTAAFLESCLFAESAPARTVDTPPLSEKLITALTSETTLLGVTIPMWVIVAVCAALLLVIIVLIIVVMHRSKAHHAAPLLDDIPASAKSSSADLSTLHDGMTVAGTDDEMTVADNSDYNGSNYNGYSSGVSVQLDMTYNGRTVCSQRVTVNGMLTIGRGNTSAGYDCDIKTDPTDKSVSRHHCTLIAEDGRLKVRNNSSQEAGTILNGMTLSGSDSASEEAMTVADDIGAAEQYVNSGDTIQIGRHYIRISY